MAPDRLLNLFARRFYVLVLFISVLLISICGRLSSVANFWAHNKIVHIECLSE